MAPRPAPRTINVRPLPSTAGVRIPNTPGGALTRSAGPGALVRSPAGGLAQWVQRIRTGLVGGGGAAGLLNPAGVTAAIGAATLPWVVQNWKGGPGAETMADRRGLSFGSRSTPRQYAGPGYMPREATIPAGRGRVGGGNAGGSNAQQWRSPGGAPAPTMPAASSVPVGYGPPPVLGSSAADNRRAEVNRMITQGGGQPLPPPVELKPYWAQNPEIKRAADEGPRSTDIGYSDRADIQEWINANRNAPKGVDGKNIVDRFLEQQRAKGLIREDTTADYSPMFSQQQLAEVDAAQSAAFSQGRDRILGMQGQLAEAPQINDQYGPGFQKGDPVNWDAAMNARLPLPGGPNAQRREQLNRVLEMPGSMVETPPSADPRWAAGFQQGPNTNWNAAANSTLNVPGMSGNVNQPVLAAAGYGANPGVDWNAAMNAELDAPTVRGDMLTMGERYNDPDEQRRRAAGFLGNQVADLQRFWRGAQ